MYKSVLIKLLISFLLFSNFVFAQSPYSISLKKDGIIGGLALSSALISYEINRNLEPLTKEEVSILKKNDINAFDRSATNYFSKGVSKASDISLITLAGTPVLLIAEKQTRNDFAVLTMMYAETILFTYSLPSFTKFGVQRIRPYAYNPDVPVNDKLTSETKRSFFSGHTTNAFASAVFLSTVYSNYYPDSKWTPYIWTGTLTAASTVGYLRYRSGKHFPSDIFVGALVGSAIGYLIPKLHENGENSDFTIMPYLYDNRAFINLNYSF